MPPTQGIYRLKDTGEREAAKTEQEAHMFECWNKQGGPGWELREKVDSVHSGSIDMTATILTWGRAINLLFSHLLI